MAPDNDSVLDLDHVPTDEELEMADQAMQAHEQNMAALCQIGVALQGHFASFTKLADLDYLEGHRLVGLTEAMGVREVASKNVPAGPTSV